MFQSSTEENPLENIIKEVKTKETGNRSREYVDLSNVAKELVNYQQRDNTDFNDLIPSSAFYSDLPKVEKGMLANEVESILKTYETRVREAKKAKSNGFTFDIPAKDPRTGALQKMAGAIALYAIKNDHVAKDYELPENLAHAGGCMDYLGDKRVLSFYFTPAKLH
ncbi:MAG: hypothetical protein ACOCQX_00965 [Candidatus Nanoarchaeia archaeon]